jgi:PAS domain S-box-containing protein
MNYVKALLYALPAVAVLILIAQKKYLLFNGLAEIFSVVIAIGIFVIGWNSRAYCRNNYLLSKELSDRTDKLAEAQEFTRSVINSLPANIAVLDSSGIIVMVNDAWRKFAVEHGGDITTTCEGSNYLDVCEKSGDGVALSCKAALHDLVQGRLNDFRLEYSCESQDGLALHFLMRAAPLKHTGGGVVVSHYDISERRKMELALQVGEERYRSLFNCMTEGFALHDIICDEQGRPCDYRFIDINPAFERLTGMKRAAVMGKRLSDVLPDEDPLWIARYGKVALSGESVHFENYSPVLQKNFDVFAYRPAPMQFAVLFIEVTARKQLEEKLQSVLRQQSLILENAPVGITFVVDRIQKWTNPKMAEMFGYTLAEMEQQSTRMFYPSEESFEDFGRGAYTAFVCGNIYSNVCEMRRKDGSLFWTRLSGKAIEPSDPLQGSIWIIEDISVQKRDADELTVSRNRLNEAQRIAHIGNWELDLVTGSLEWSDEVYRIFEIDPAHTCASYQTFLSAIHPDDRERVNRAHSASLENRTVYSIKHRLLMPDGRIKYVYERCETDYDQAGRPLCSLGTVQDITELENSRLAAESAGKIKSEFLTTMSHEIRTPLNGILGMARLMRNTTLSTLQREQVETIIMSGNDLLRQLNDILDFSRIEADQIQLEYAPFSLEQCVNDVLRAHQVAFMAKGLHTSVTVAGDLPGLVWGDAFRVRQTLHNLIGNAVKFTERGSIDIAVTTVKREREVIMINLAVNDTGIGISDEALEAIFQPFVQADGSINRNFGGTGLGLSISRKLAQLMGGDICAVNRPGGGSCFNFLLSCRLPQE